MSESKEFVSTISTKGQLTVPVQIRRALGIQPQDRLIVRLTERKFEVEPFPMTLEEVYGSVEPINRPEDFDRILEIAREERAVRAASKGLE